MMDKEKNIDNAIIKLIYFSIKNDYSTFYKDLRDKSGVKEYELKKSILRLKQRGEIIYSKKMGWLLSKNFSKMILEDKNL
jgi:hypothetical protein